MIKDDELGLKVAESKEEELWVKTKEEAEQLIKQSKENLIIQKGMLELAERKLKEIENEK